MNAAEQKTRGNRIAELGNRMDQALGEVEDATADLIAGALRATAIKIDEERDARYNMDRDQRAYIDAGDKELRAYIEGQGNVLYELRARVEQLEARTIRRRLRKLFSGY